MVVAALAHSASRLGSGVAGSASRGRDPWRHLRGAYGLGPATRRRDVLARPLDEEGGPTRPSWREDDSVTNKIPQSWFGPNRDGLLDPKRLTPAERTRLSRQDPDWAAQEQARRKSTDPLIR